MSNKDDLQFIQFYCFISADIFAVLHYTSKISERSKFIPAGGQLPALFELEASICTDFDGGNSCYLPNGKVVGTI